MDKRHELVLQVTDYSHQELAKAARYYDTVDKFPEEQMIHLFSLAILPSLYKNLNDLTYHDYLSVIRLVSKNFPALGSILLTQESHCVWPISTFGTTQQKERYLEKALHGEIYGCFALNEPITGSEIEEMKTVAHQTETGWVLSGNKDYISNSPIASVLLIAAKTIALDGTQGYAIFVIDKKTNGLKVGELEEKMGIKALPVASVQLDKVQLTDDNLLGGVVNGLPQIDSILNRNRLAVAAQSLGIAGGALDRGLKYVSYNRNLGKRLIDMTSIQYKLADIETGIYSARSLLMQVINSRQEQDERMVAMTKLTASNLAIETTESIINMSGGYGYMRNNDIERFVRDAKITAIYGSSSDRLRSIIAKPWVNKKCKVKEE